MYSKLNQILELNFCHNNVVVYNDDIIIIFNLSLIRMVKKIEIQIQFLSPIEVYFISSLHMLVFAKFTIPDCCLDSHHIIILFLSLFFIESPPYRAP